MEGGGRGCSHSGRRGGAGVSPTVEGGGGVAPIEEGGGGVAPIEEGGSQSRELTDTVILQTISSGKGFLIFRSRRSRHVAISSMKTHTSFCGGHRRLELTPGRQG